MRKLHFFSINFQFQKTAVFDRKCLANMPQYKTHFDLDNFIANRDGTAGALLLNIMTFK